MIIKPRIRGFICTTAHPAGCAAHVASKSTMSRRKAPSPGAPKRVLVVGASTGYGLASRIVPAFARGRVTLGVFFEKPGEEGRTGSAGWYNSVAFEKAAHADGLYAKSINGDAFSDAMKQQAIDSSRRTLARWMGDLQPRLPRRTHPRTGETHNSTLKPSARPTPPRPSIPTKE